MKVLVATDGSEAAVDAARAAQRLFAAGDAEVLVLSVATSPEISMVTSPADALAAPIVATDDGMRRALVKEAEEAVSRTIDAIDAIGPPARSLVVAGEAGPDICRVAGEEAADVVVVGSRGLGPIRRAVLGSVSDHVVHNAPCPVLVVRPSP